MRKFIVVAVVGFLAQLVDGSLGMAYGATSSSLLLSLAAVTPVIASASVHMAEIGTTLVSGISHWKLKNVDWGVVGRIAIPGAIGAFLGATVLSNLSTEAAGPVMSGILFGLGIYIFIRFLFGLRPRLRSKVGLKFLAPLGIFAGFIDSTGGGGWGPVATPALLTDGRMEPRKVVGSIDTSEFVVAVSASIGFLIGIGSSGMRWDLVLALLLGGVLAAPLAAYLVRIAPAYLLGIAVSGVILITNSRTLMKAAEVDGGNRWFVYAAILAIVLAGGVYVVRRHRRQSRDASPEQVEETANV